MTYMLYESHDGKGCTQFLNEYVNMSGEYMNNPSMDGGYS